MASAAPTSDHTPQPRIANASATNDETRAVRTSILALRSNCRSRAIRARGSAEKPEEDEGEAERAQDDGHARFREEVRHQRRPEEQEGCPEQVSQQRGPEEGFQPRPIHRRSLDDDGPDAEVADQHEQADGQRGHGHQAVVAGREQPDDENRREPGDDLAEDARRAEPQRASPRPGRAWRGCRVSTPTCSSGSLTRRTGGGVERSGVRARRHSVPGPGRLGEALTRVLAIALDVDVQP